ncbi:MAG: hypothetical protein AAGA68_04490 [Pseudomonadota bacterium]
MVAKRKLYARLDALEAQLKAGLLEHLPNAARGENDLVFCVSPFNPHPELKHSTDKTTERLVALGVQILALRGKLGEPEDERSPAVRICWYCRQWSDLGVEHRASAAQLAQRFLAELEGEPTDGS